MINHCNFFHQILEALIMSCLLQAHQARFKSIAFPTIGAGNLKFPKDIIAATFVECVKKFAYSNPQTSLLDVRIIVVKSPDMEEVRDLF